MTRSRGTELERAILDEARQLLLRQGYTDLSMRRIAKAVGCTATSIYLYFENKDGLIHALIDEGMGKLRSELESACAEGQPEDGVSSNGSSNGSGNGSVNGNGRPSSGSSKLERLCRRFVGFGLENPEYYEIMFMLHAKHMERYPTENYRRARSNLDLFREALGELAGGRDIDDPDLERASTLIWTSLHGLVSLLIAQRVDVSIDVNGLVDGAVANANRMAAQIAENARVSLNQS